MDSSPSTIHTRTHPLLYPFFTLPHSQLILASPLAVLAEVVHGHDLDDEAGPAREVLRALSAARLRVVLLPREPGLRPALVHRLHQVPAQPRIQATGLRLVGALLQRQVLYIYAKKLSRLAKVYIYRV